MVVAAGEKNCVSGGGQRLSFAVLDAGIASRGLVGRWGVWRGGAPWFVAGETRV